MRISVVGAGYVGLVTGACLSEIGHQVICIDNNEEKIKILKNGGIPIYEPGLEEIIKRNTSRNLLSFSTNIEEGVKNSDVIFIAVNTPPLPNGEADLFYVEKVAKEIAQNMDEYKVIVEKSTVPVETGEKIKKTIQLYRKKDVDFAIVSNPEFLQEGSAVENFLHPDRIVLGVESEKEEKIMREIYQQINAPIIVTDIKSAELIKHASNSFLATKISYINAVANICEKVGGDIEQIALGMGLDKRIGMHFLKAGVGWGGSCFPKDVAAFIKIAQKAGYDFQLLKAVEIINLKQRELLVQKIESSLWNLRSKIITILGLSFKPNTDDMRGAPSIDIIKMLQEKQAIVRAYDPVAIPKAKNIFKNVDFYTDVYLALEGSDAMVILTDWDEFKSLKLEKIKEIMTTPIIIDGRNIFNPEQVRKSGFIYDCIGRKKCEY